jgi:hypothetical protein
VPFGHDERLHKLMKKAFSTISKQEIIKVKYNQNITKIQLFGSKHLDRDFYFDMFEHVTYGSPSDGYKQRMKRHYDWVKFNKD